MVWITALLALVPIVAAPPASIQGPAVEAPRAIDPVRTPAGMEMNRLLRLGRPRDCDKSGIVGALSALDAPLVPPALSVLAARKLPPLGTGGEQILSELQEQLLLDALTKLDADAVWTCVESALVPKDPRTPPTPSVRRAAVQVTGACGMPAQIGRIAAIALRPDETVLAPEMEEAWKSALVRIYGRRPAALLQLPAAWHSFRSELLPALAAGAGAQGDPRALEFLAEMLDQPGDVSSIALAELSRQRAPDDIPSGLLDRLRQMLDPAEPMRCQAACNALGQLGDFGSAEELELLLDSESDGIQRTAHSALCNLSGLSLPLQGSAWRVWRVRESEWFESSEAALYQAVRTGTEDEAREALTDIGVHRWERHALSSLAAEALGRPEAELHAQACSLLVALGSPRARPLLEAALQVAEPDDEALLRDALASCAAH